MINVIAERRDDIAALCRKHHVKRLELFGSAARGDFDPAESDVDFFVEFDDLGWKGSADRYFGLLFGLEDLLRRKIDLVERSAIRNPHFLPVAERHVQLIYDDGSAQAA